MDAPTFSVIVPVYNGSDTIDRCLSSLQSQECSNFEVIVVDDGSTDPTLEIVETYSNRYAVRILRQDRQGPSSASNRGLRDSRGEYVVFLHADDEVSPQWLTAFSKLSEETGHPGLMSCGVRMVFVGNEDTSEVECKYPKDLGPVFSNLHALFLPGAYVIGREILLELEGFVDGLNYGEHFELGLRLASWADDHSMVVGSTRELLVTKYHDRSPSQVTRYDRIRREGARYTLDHHSNRLTRDARLAANYHAVAGVASMRLGEPGDARKHFREAVRLNPTLKNILRFGAATFPFLQPKSWSRG